MATRKIRKIGRKTRGRKCAKRGGVDFSSVFSSKHKIAPVTTSELEKQELQKLKNALSEMQHKIDAKKNTSRKSTKK